jgi:hypothetical protein
LRNTFWLLLLAAVSAAAAHAQEGAVHFLSREQARVALTEGAERNYYARLQVGEMRAKTGLPLRNLSLQAAREQVRVAYGAATEDFTEDEQAAVRAGIETLQPILQTKAPLYARTPWSFIKLNQTIEGGLPHTRGDSIVLSDSVLAAMARLRAQAKPGWPMRMWNLLIHEQTHVLQRHNPALFAELYTEAFGFRHVRLDSPPQWLVLRRVVNPDAPDADWVFPIDENGARRWVLPDIVLASLENPRMPQDFKLVALAVKPQRASWSYADQSELLELQQLSSLDGYVRAFPDAQEIFHPNEICAVMLAQLIAGAAVSQPEHELWAKTRAWIDSALR